MSVLRAADAFAVHGRSRVRHAVSSGRWQRPVRGVYVTHNGPLSTIDRLEVALAGSPPGAVLAGGTALTVDGLEGFEPSAVHVAIPEGSDRPRVPGVVTHWSTRLDDSDVHPARTPRRTRTQRSVIDLASWAASDRYARAAVLASFQQGLVEATGMHRALDRRSTVRRAGLVRESVLDAEGGLQSLPELDFDDLVILAGLPTPTRQRAVRGPNGRYHLDVEWEELGVAVEVHGLPHHGVVQWSQDLIRANEVVIAGPRLLVFTSYVVRHEPGVVLDQFVRALRAAGWTGVVKPIARRSSRRSGPRGRAV